MNTKKTTAIGVHLGTNCIRCAVYIKGQYTILKSPWGIDVVPLYYALVHDDCTDYLLGKDAQQFSFIAPDCCVYDLGRFTNELTPEKFNHLQKKLLFPCQVTRSNEGNLGVILNRPAHDYAEFWPMNRILKRVFAVIQDYNRYNEDQLAQEITDIVISVPSHWSLQQQEITKNVVKEAGFQSVNTISRSLACFIGWSTERRVSHGTYLTVAIGASHSQVSVFRIAHQRIELVYQSVPLEIGGEDFDCQLVRHCCHRFAQEQGIDLLKEHSMFQSAIERLRSHCEQAKRELTVAERTVINIPNIVSDIDFALTMTRDELENVCREEIAKIASYIDNEVYRIDLRDMADIVPFGGTTRMPCIQFQLREIFRGVAVNQAIRSYADLASLYGAASVAAAPEFYAYLNDKAFLKRTGYISDVYEPETVTDHKSKIPIVVTRIERELITEIQPGSIGVAIWKAEENEDNRTDKMLSTWKERAVEEKANRKVVETTVRKPDLLHPEEKPTPPNPPERTVSREQEQSLPTEDERPRSVQNHDQVAVQPVAEKRRQSESERNQLPPRESLTERFSAEADVAYLDGDQDPNNFRAIIKIFERNANNKERYLVFTDPETRKEFFSTKIEPDMIEAILKHRTFNVFHDKHTLSQIALATSNEAKEFHFWTQSYKDVEPVEDEVFQNGKSGKPEKEQYGNGRSKQVAKKEKIKGKQEQTNTEKKPPVCLDKIVSRGQEQRVHTIPDVDGQRSLAFIQNHDREQADVQSSVEKRQSEPESSQLPPRKSLTERFSGVADIAYLEDDQDPQNMRATVKILEQIAQNKDRYLVFVDIKTRKKFFTLKIVPEMIEAILKHRTFNIHHDNHTLSQIAFATTYEAKEFSVWAQSYEDVEAVEDDEKFPGGMSRRPEETQYDKEQSKQDAKKGKRSAGISRVYHAFRSAVRRGRDE